MHLLQYNIVSVVTNNHVFERRNSFLTHVYMCFNISTDKNTLKHVKKKFKVKGQITDDEFGSLNHPV